MNIVLKIKLLSLLNKATNIISRKDQTMSIKIPQLIQLVTTLSATIGLPTLATNFVHSHPAVYLGIVSAAVVLHSIVPSIFNDPSDAEKLTSKYGKISVLLLALFLVPSLRAQSVQNFYAAGASYNNGATPAVAGTALYAHLVSNSDTYMFTAIDAVPNTLKPFTVTTNVGVGIAQRVLTLGKIPIYIPTAAGISWTGTNTGWQWNTGAMAIVYTKGSFTVDPVVRVVKSSVSAGTGYQPVVGLLFGWGK
jgi:hypothetical protein